MPDESPREFLEVLPLAVRQAMHLPLTYHLLSRTDEPAPHMPAAPSEHHRARRYVCIPYHKPISRCFGAER